LYAYIILGTSELKVYFYFNKQVFHYVNIIKAYSHDMKILYIKSGLLIVVLITALDNCVSIMAKTMRVKNGYL
jgi:hypothetical protein